MQICKYFGFIFIAALNLCVIGKDLTHAEECDLFDWPCKEETITYEESGNSYSYSKTDPCRDDGVHWEYPNDSNFYFSNVFFIKQKAKNGDQLDLIKRVYCNEKDGSEIVEYSAIVRDKGEDPFPLDLMEDAMARAKKAFGECVVKIGRFLLKNQLVFMEKLADDQKILLDECDVLDSSHNKKMIINESFGDSYEYFKKKYSGVNAINWKHPKCSDFVLSKSFYIKEKQKENGYRTMLWKLIFNNEKDGSEIIEYWGWYDASFSEDLMPIFIPSIKAKSKKLFEFYVLEIAELENKQN